MAGLTKRPNGYWYIIYRVDGRQKMTSTGTKRKSDANTELSRWEKERAKKRAAGIDPDAVSQDPDPETFWEAYSAYMAQRLRTSTIEQRTWAWNWFVKDFHPDTLGQVTREQVETHRDQYKGRSITWIGFYKNMRRCYNAAQTITFPGQTRPLYSGTNPFAAVTAPRSDSAEKRILTEAEIERLMKAAVKHSGHPNADNIAGAIALGLYQGLRRAEIAACRWEWFDFDVNRLNVISTPGGFETKNSKSRTMPQFNVTLKYLGKPQESGYVYRPEIPWKEGQTNRLSFRTSLDCVVEKARLGWSVGPHTLRHTFISLALRRGCSVWEVGKWVGHSSAYMTEHYGHYIQPDAATLDLFGK